MASQHLSDQEHQVKETEVLALRHLQGRTSPVGDKGRPFTVFSAVEGGHPPCTPVPLKGPTESSTVVTPPHHFLNHTVWALSINAMPSTVPMRSIWAFILELRTGRRLFQMCIREGF